MNNSLGKFSRKLRTISWRDWSIYSIVVVTFVGLWILADEVHWWKGIATRCVTTSDDGKSIGVTFNIKDSRYRSYFCLYDDHLRLKQRFRLNSNYSYSLHALSQDGSYLLYCVRDLCKYPYPVDVQFELISLNGDAAPVHINASKAVADSTSLHHWGQNVSSLQLVGQPPNKFIFCVSDQLFFLNLFDQRSSSEEFRLWNISQNRNYFTADGPLQTRCYRIDPAGLVLKHEDPLPRQPYGPRTHSAASSNGLLGIQEPNQRRIRVIDLLKDASQNREIMIPWLARAQLIAVSDDRDSLLLANEIAEHTANDIELYVVSAKQKLAVAQYVLDDSWYLGRPKLLGDHRVVFQCGSRKLNAQALAIWDWKESTTKKLLLETVTKGTERLIDGGFVVAVLVWVGIFFWIASHKKHISFGIATMACGVALLNRWAHLSPDAENLVFTPDEADALFPILCQVGLSLSSLWAFRYMRTIQASALVAVLSIYAAHWYQFAVDSRSVNSLLFKAYFIDTFLVFGAGMILAHLGKVARSFRRFKLTLFNLWSLIFVVAIVIKPLIDIAFESQNATTTFASGVSGAFWLALTLVADWKSRRSLHRYDFLFVAVTLIACLFISASLMLLHWPRFLAFGLPGMYLVDFVLTWGLSRLVQVSFPAQTSEGESALQLTNENMTPI